MVQPEPTHRVGNGVDRNQVGHSNDLDNRVDDSGDDHILDVTRVLFTFDLDNPDDSHVHTFDASSQRCGIGERFDLNLNNSIVKRIRTANTSTNTTASTGTTSPASGTASPSNNSSASTGSSSSTTGSANASTNTTASAGNSTPSNCTPGAATKCGGRDMHNEPGLFSNRVDFHQCLVHGDGKYHDVHFEPGQLRCLDRLGIDQHVDRRELRPRFRSSFHDNVNLGEVGSLIRNAIPGQPRLAVPGCCRAAKRPVIAATKRC